jgi:hypothetical protein
MKFRGFQFCLTIVVCLSSSAIAQAPIQPVQWLGSIAKKTPIEPGRRATIEVEGNIQDGWHIYGLDQVSGGPTPLRVILDDNEFMQSAGAIKGTEPVKKHDTSFDLETQVYTHSFTLQLPVLVKQHPATGKQAVSLSVRFQACSDRVCLPPRTVHVAVPIEINPGS